MSNNQKSKEKKFVKLNASANKDEINAIQRRVKNGELKWSFYATDGDIGYHFYEVLKK